MSLSAMDVKKVAHLARLAITEKRLKIRSRIIEYTRFSGANEC